MAAVGPTIPVATSSIVPGVTDEELERRVSDLCEALRRRAGPEEMEPLIGRCCSLNVALKAAAAKGDCASMKILLKGGAKGDEYGDPVPRETALYFAARGGHVTAVKLLLDRGVDPCADIQIAINESNSTAMKTLLDAGTNPNGYEVGGIWGDGIVPLHQAIAPMRPRTSINDNDDIVKLLLDRGADPHCREILLNRTPLHVAVGFSSVNVMRALLEAGAKVNSKDASGKTPLHWAVRCFKPEKVRVLLQAGADPLAKTKKTGYSPKYTPLDWLAENIAKERYAPPLPRRVQTLEVYLSAVPIRHIKRPESLETDASSARALMGVYNWRLRKRVVLWRRAVEEAAGITEDTEPMRARLDVVGKSKVEKAARCVCS